VLEGKLWVADITKEYCNRHGGITKYFNMNEVTEFTEEKRRGYLKEMLKLKEQCNVGLSKYSNYRLEDELVLRQMF